ncbi:MAG: glycosyl transferase [Myxococcales bacterium]|nr:glycosyl transferase [Myxococcales bacterium]
MFLGHKIGVVVPARDEEPLLGDTLHNIPDFTDHILVVDDGSEDGTAEVVRSFMHVDARVELRMHPEPAGVGGAILAGYQALYEKGCDVVAVMAGDAQMDPADLSAIIRPICEDRADYVKGDRFAHDAVWTTMPFDRMFGNLVLTWVTRGVSGYAKLRDAQCGYTAIRSTLIPSLMEHPVHPGYGFPNALLAHLGVLGVRLEQVCVRPVYGSERSGLNLGNVLRTYPGVLWKAWRFRKTHQREGDGKVDSSPEPVDVSSNADVGAIHH